MRSAFPIFDTSTRGEKNVPRSQLVVNLRRTNNSNAVVFDVQAMLSPEMQKEMDEFKRQERDANAESKAEKARVKEKESSKPTQSAKQVHRGAPGRPQGRASRG